MAQFNMLNVAETAGRGRQERQQEEINQMQADAFQTQFDEEQRMQNTRWLAGAAKYGMENPAAIPQLIAEGQRRGVIDGSYSAQSITPEQLEQVYQGAMAAMGGPQFEDITAEEVPYAQRSLAGEVRQVGATRGGPTSNMRDLAEWQRLRRTHGPESDEVKTFEAQIMTPKIFDRGGVPYAYTVGGLEGLSTEERELRAREDQARRAQLGKGQADITTEAISVGMRQADSTAVLRRGLELLDLIGTGRPEEVALAAKTLFGIAGADETELNANLGKAILSQLRQTFGAQFTAEEGKRLEWIEANFGKSTEGNKRLLQQSLKQAERAARRGLDAAKRSGDVWAAQEIQNALDYSLTPTDDFQQKWDAAESGEVLLAPDGTYRRKP